ncbi:MAG TPA: hypothetical protein VGE97_06650 [Nitrososphaera sp.]|jgi:hypothetical protein
MYDKFQFVNNDSEVVDFLMTITGSGYICLTDVNFEIITSTNDRDRMEANASWPSFVYYKRLLTHIEADILANSPQEFHTFWHTTLQKIMVAPDALQTFRTQGALVIRPAGVTEDWRIPVVVDSPPGIPRGGLSPSAGKMTMTLKSTTPYWYRVTSNDFVWHV